MLDNTGQTDAATTPTWAEWTAASKRSGSWAKNAPPRWQLVDEALRSIARRRAALDAEEARWLREAEKLKLWRELGMVSALDYLERIFGYGPRAAMERLRVARALADLPMLEAALTRGTLPYTAVRELTRVVLRSTEQPWHDAAVGKNLRQIEELVAGHKPGDLPDDPRDPENVMRRVTLELTPAAYVMLRRARVELDALQAKHLNDSELVEALCSPARGDASESSGRAKFQVWMTVCERCNAGAIDGGGVRAPVDPGTVDRAMCDVQRSGSERGARPARMRQDIPPATYRMVWRRDHGRCQSPGCRSTRGLEMHHLVHREDGGTHDPSNLSLRCFACHQAHHEGRIRIGGRAPDGLTFERTHQASTAHVDARDPEVPDEER